MQSLSNMDKVRINNSVSGTGVSAPPRKIFRFSFSESEDAEESFRFEQTRQQQEAQHEGEERELQRGYQEVQDDNSESEDEDEFGSNLDEEYRRAWENSKARAKTHLDMMYARYTKPHEENIGPNWTIETDLGVLQVSKRDRKSLDSGQQLTDQVINAFGHCITKGSRHVLFLESHLIKQFDDAFVCERPLRVMQNAGFSAAIDVVVIPINTRNAHWSLIGVNLCSRSIYHYDSVIGGVSTERIDNVFRIICKLLDDSIGNATAALWNRYPQELCYIQENGIDCGAFTCYHLQSLVEANISRLPVPIMSINHDGRLDVNAYRRTLLLAIQMFKS